MELPLREEFVDTNPVTNSLGDVDYYQTYKKLQKRFELADKVATTLFDTENSSRQTLAFLKRRNDALLEFLAGVEPKQEIEMDQARLEALVAQCPRVGECIEPIGDMDTEGAQVHKKHFESMYLDEQVSDLVNDDVTPLEISPLLAEWWCHTHGLPLVLKLFAVGDIGIEGVQPGYIGSGIEMNWSETEKKRPQKKRAEKKKKEEWMTRYRRNDWCIDE